MHHVDSEVGGHGLGHVAAVARGHGHLGHAHLVQVLHHRPRVGADGVLQHDESGRPVVHPHQHEAGAVAVGGRALVEQ
jgi:hypothetical protein